MRTIDSAHGGTGWEPRRSNHLNDIGVIWNKCGVSSETHTLKHVLLRRPGKEIENIIDPVPILWTKTMDIEKARYQHDSLAQIYLDLGVKVDYIEDKKANIFPNIMYVRDLFAMTPQGAVISRLASKVRAGEELIVSRTLSNLNIPILATAFNNMYLEGPDILIVNKDLVFLGIGLRTTYESAKFVATLLEQQGFSEIKFIQTTYGCGHLDGVVNILNDKYAVVIPQRASYEMIITLKKHGYEIIELTENFEIDQLMAINFVSINNEKIVINKGAKDSIAKYKKCGIECIEVDVSELTNGGGSVHCMTGIIHRG